MAERRGHGDISLSPRRERDEIVGATVVASHAGDMIATISVAMAGGGLGKIGRAILPYPTQAEAIGGGGTP